MSVDLSASIYAQYLRARKRADEAAKRSDWPQAATANRQCAALMRQYAEFTSDPGVRQQRLEKVQAHETVVGQLENVPIPSHLVETPATNSEDNYEAAVMALVYRSNVDWDDIGGLEKTKREIKAADGLALARKPEGVQLTGWRNILFYGPPGTGKTLLAAATSNGLEATFFNVKVSDLLSKYFGESSRLVSALYSAARRNSPAVIFLDEFESLTPQRGGGDSGAERRIVSTLLPELDGLTSKDSTAYVLTIAATNLPWLLDKAVLSRFEKKIYIPLPDEAARDAILRLQLERRGYASEVSYPELVRFTEGLSGREIERVCKEAIGRMTERANPDLLRHVEQGRESVAGYQIRVIPLMADDFWAAFEPVQPETTLADLEHYERWRERADK